MKNLNLELDKLYITISDKKPAHNKQIGNRAGEMLLLNFCARLKSSNSIQHLC
jgi:hypothetical protein